MRAPRSLVLSVTYCSLATDAKLNATHIGAGDELVVGGKEVSGLAERLPIAAWLTAVVLRLKSVWSRVYAPQGC